MFIKQKSTCEICSGEMVKVTPNNRLCEECRPGHKKEYQKQYQNKNRERMRKQSLEYYYNNLGEQRRKARERMRKKYGKK